MFKKLIYVEKMSEHNIVFSILLLLYSKIDDDV